MLPYMYILFISFYALDRLSLLYGRWHFVDAIFLTFPLTAIILVLLRKHISNVFVGPFFLGWFLFESYYSIVNPLGGGFFSLIYSFIALVFCVIFPYLIFKVVKRHK